MTIKQAVFVGVNCFNPNSHISHGVNNINRGYNHHAPATGTRQGRSLSVHQNKTVSEASNHSGMRTKDNDNNDDEISFDGEYDYSFSTPRRGAENMNFRRIW